jgi:hypothetical protein
MRDQDDQIPEAVRSAAADYNSPPELDRADMDTMWSAIEAEAFTQPRSTFDVVRRTSDFKRFFSTATLLPLAAVLLLGVTIGRVLPRGGDVPVEITTTVANADSARIPEPYQSTTSRYLGQAAALLVALPGEVGAGRADEPYMGRAHDLLLTTRLLLDSPASADPRFRTLLEDLELVLAQVVRLQSATSADELELIRQALEQRDVLPRLRTAVADISADD